MDSNAHDGDEGGYITFFPLKVNNTIGKLIRSPDGASFR